MCRLAPPLVSPKIPSLCFVVAGVRTYACMRQGAAALESCRLARTHGNRLHVLSVPFMRFRLPFLRGYFFFQHPSETIQRRNGQCANKRPISQNARATDGTLSFERNS